MKLLAIDASGQTASVAVTDGYITLGEFTVSAPARHSAILLPMIDQLFAAAGLGLSDMDAIACVSGPGSFTGLRIGAATAMGLGDRLIPVPTLDALAYNVSNGLCAGLRVMPMLDARREQVYTAVYTLDGAGFPRRGTDYRALSVAEALRLLDGRPALFTGDGASAYESAIRGLYPAAVFAPPNANRQRAASAGLCAARMLQDGYTPLSAIDILYVRKPQAVREREERAAAVSPREG